MASDSPQTALLDNYQAVVSAFCEFLTVAVHTILYERDIYPRTSFLSARKYNYPVKQSRHPKVCQWIEDAIAAVEAELLKCTILQTSLIVYSPTSIPLERFVFSTASFPIIPSTDLLTPFTFTFSPSTSSSSPPSTPPRPPHLIDLHTQFRALFSRLSTFTSSLSPLPPDCTFTIAIDLREQPQGIPPIRHPTKWVAADVRVQKPTEPKGTWALDGAADADTSKSVSFDDAPIPVLYKPPTVEDATDDMPMPADSQAQQSEKSNKISDFLFSSPTEQPVAASQQTGSGQGAGGKYKSKKGEFYNGAVARPVRTVEVGPFIMEFWVEEGEGKEEALKVAKQAGLGSQAEGTRGEGEVKSQIQREKEDREGEL